MQLAYDNTEVSWLLLHNWVKEGRQLSKEEEKIYAELRDAVKKDVANVDDNLRARAAAQKEKVSRMKGRPMGPAALMTVMDDARTISWRVKECAFHVANNITNSCWEAHDIVLKDSAVKSACTVISNPSTPDFVTSAAVGFLCSLSYRPASRKGMLDQQVSVSICVSSSLSLSLSLSVCLSPYFYLIVSVSLSVSVFASVSVSASASVCWMSSR